MTRYAGIPSHESCNLLLMTYSPMLSLYLCICVFVYLSILHLIHGYVIFDMHESHAFQKYSTSCVF